MTDSLFFVFIGISVLGFGMHSVLIVSFARRYDALVVATYRGLSLIMTMLPILFFVSWEEVLAVKDQALPLLLSSGIGSIAFTLSLTASRYLPVGVSSSLRQTISVPIAIVIGMLFLQEYLTSIQILLLVGIGGSAIWLTLLRSDHPHLDPEQAWWGIFLSICAGVGSAFAWYFFSIAARDVHPFVAAYFVEVAVGLFTLLYLIMLRASGLHTASVLIPFRTLGSIVLVGMLTILGTTGYALAINHGPYPLASGLMMGTILVATVIAWFLFKERLKALQIGLIVVAAVMMFLIKMVS